MKDLNERLQYKSTLGGPDRELGVVGTGLMLVALAIFVYGGYQLYQYFSLGQGRGAYVSECSGATLDTLPQTNPQGSCYVVVARVHIRSNISKGAALMTYVQPTLPDGETLKEYTLDNAIKLDDVDGQYLVQIWRDRLTEIKIGNDTHATIDCPSATRWHLRNGGIMFLIFGLFMGGLVYGCRPRVS